MRSRKRGIVVDEGPASAERFEHAIGTVLRVSKEELERREAAYELARKDKPRRGPKPTEK